MPAYFITATDTDAGKTYITSGLLAAAQQKGIDCIGLKPLASGVSDDGLGDIDLIKAALQNRYTQEQINCYAFREAIAPHLAAKIHDVQIDPDLILEQYRQYQNRELCLVEGVGGWYVPLNEQILMPELIKKMNIPVILIVNIKTGCINHSLLTIKAIADSQLKLKGWVANQLETTIDQENVATIARLTGCAPLAVIKKKKNLSLIDFKEQLILQTIDKSLFDLLDKIITK